MKEVVAALFLVFAMGTISVILVKIQKRGLKSVPVALEAVREGVARWARPVQSRAGPSSCGYSGSSEVV